METRKGIYIYISEEIEIGITCVNRGDSTSVDCWVNFWSHDDEERRE